MESTWDAPACGPQNTVNSEGSLALSHSKGQALVLKGLAVFCLFPCCCVGGQWLAGLMSTNAKVEPCMTENDIQAGQHCLSHLESAPPILEHHPWPICFTAANEFKAP